MSAENKTSLIARAREIFLGALERPKAERAAFLDAACRTDAALRKRVEELLREEEEMGGFLETPAASGARDSTLDLGTAIIASVTEQPGDQIDRYKLLQKIGEGGCGVVYMAEQEKPVRRRVALKVIKLGMDTKSVIARFEAERQALAMMDHPNIAKVFDAGATDTGRPYFVMELVRGIRITDYCDENNLSTEERLKLFILVCQAIQHAHQKGIIHRDIKPSNILVTLHDGVPVPKVIDFGIAKATEQRLTEKTLFTEFHAFIGTPAYTSPEQAEMSGLDIDTRSDIYALGVLLYELLTGRPPFDPEHLLRSGLDEMRRIIREEEPQRPSTRLSTMGMDEATTLSLARQTRIPVLVEAVRGDLDWISMKCLEKDRTRRYDSASDLAADLQRYLADEPVLARPPSNLYRAQKLLRRHRGAFAAAAVITLTLLTGITISVWQAVRATRAERLAVNARREESALRRRAEQGETAARLNEYVADINLAQQSLTAGNLGRAVQLLDKHRPQPGQADLRGFEWRYLWQLCQGDEHASLPVQDGTVQALAVSPDGRLLAVGLREEINIWNLQTRGLVTNFSKGAVSLAFLPDGHSLISASPANVRVWNTADWTERLVLNNSAGPMTLSSNATRLATLNRQGVRIWNTATWQELNPIPDASGPIAFSPDGRTLAAESRGVGITLWSVDGSRPPVMLQASSNLFLSGPWQRSERALTFTPDGKSILAARNTLSNRGVFVLSVWDAETGEETSVIPEDPEHVEHTGAITSLVFSPDGRTLATASMDHSIRLWDFDQAQLSAVLQGHVQEVWSLAFSPDGQTLVSGAKDGSVKIWPTRRQKKEDALPGTWQPLAMSKDSHTLAALNRQGTVAFLNLATQEPEQQFQLDLNRFRFFSSQSAQSAVSLSDDLKAMAQVLDDGSVKLWNTESREFQTLKAPGGPVDLVVLSPEGHRLITGGRFRGLRLWDLRHGTNTPLAADGRVIFSPDGQTLATLQRGSILELRDVATLNLRTNLLAELPAGNEATFSRDSRRLAVACPDYAIRLLDATTGELLGTFTGHKQSVASIAFSPDGKTLATASDDSTLKFWNIATQQELLNIRRLGGALRGLVFSPDGRLLVGGGSFTLQSGGLRFYRAPSSDETDAGKRVSSSK